MAIGSSHSQDRLVPRWAKRAIEKGKGMVEQDPEGAAALGLTVRLAFVRQNGSSRNRRWDAICNATIIGKLGGNSSHV
jgi:hypothetical protein